MSDVLDHPRTLCNGAEIGHHNAAGHSNDGQLAQHCDPGSVHVDRPPAQALTVVPDSRKDDIRRTTHPMTAQEAPQELLPTGTAGLAAVQDAAGVSGRHTSAALRARIRAHVDEAARCLYRSLESETPVCREHFVRMAARLLFTATALADGEERRILSRYFGQAQALAVFFYGDGRGVARLLDELVGMGARRP